MRARFDSNTRDKYRCHLRGADQNSKFFWLELDELRRRTNPLQERLKVARAELAKAQAAALDDGRLETMGEEIAAFLSCLRERQQRLTSEEKQQIVRLLVKEIVISKDTVKVHHSIPIPEKN